MKSLAWLDNKWVHLLLRWALAGVFIFAAVSKITAPDKFAIAISNYRLLPHEWVNLAAIVVPWVEVMTALLLIFGVWVRASALVFTGMTVAFFFMISSALARGLNIECGCFGTIGGKRVGLTSLLLDAALLLMAAWLVWRVKNASQPEPGSNVSGGINSESQSAQPS